MLLPVTPLDRVLGDRTAKSFAKHLGLKTVSDLLLHFPRRYSTRGELTPIGELPIGEPVTVIAEILDVRERPMSGRKGGILEVRITDGNGSMSLTFFNQSWRQKELKPGARGLFAGKTGLYQGKLQLAHPDYELFPEEISEVDAKKWADLPIPIYPASSSASTWAISRAVGVVLDTLDPILEDEIREPGLLTIDQAIRWIHKPEIAGHWQQARDTLRFHEAFELQAALIKRKLENAHTLTTARVPGVNGILARFDAALPFTLTDGQISVGNEILEDLARNHPMNRLLQGEVGSGKTLVALRAMLAVAETDGQAALIAPTEVLASQHFASMQKTLGEGLSKELGLTLLTGQMGTPERKRAMLQIVSGKARIVIGTHALIAEKVSFLDLALVVVDEQHRFGVEQREALRLKGTTPPHVLTMTATPIPRTLAVTLFGDLDVSTLTQLPKGRKEISSHVVQLSNPALIARTWQRIAEEVASGRQAFVVCPRIDDTDEPTDIEADADAKKPLAAAVSIAESLKANPVLSNVRIGLLHGRMSSEEKAEVMARFAARELDLLVSTTVIEVGVDVPNATVMVVLDAERFGVSQLHQLRGRVGRGEHPGLCLLLTGAEDGSLALERVQAVASTTDGFKLSEIDLELRREGDVLGASQSGGRSSLRLLRVVQDAELINHARELALKLLSDDPTLDKNPVLAESLYRMDAAAQANLAKA